MSIAIADPLTVARHYAASPDDWPLAPRFDPEKRWYHRLSGPEDELEVWLLSWLPGQGTGWHDHGGSAGAFVLVSGTLLEQTVSDGLTQVAHVPGAGRAFGPHHIHRLVNFSRRPAVSVHAYAPSLSTMTRYRLELGQLHIEGVDRAGAQW